MTHPNQLPFQLLTRQNLPPPLRESRNSNLVVHDDVPVQCDDEVGSI